MMLPTIHLNGTNPDDLNENAEKVYRACTALLEALSSAVPNARDYYTQDDGAHVSAADEHRERVAAVENIREEMIVIADHLHTNKRRGRQ